MDAKVPHRSRLAVIILFSHEGGGGDGQIRTADLSLRRRPLYPSELRPRLVLDSKASKVEFGRKIESIAFAPAV